MWAWPVDFFHTECDAHFHNVMTKWLEASTATRFNRILSGDQLRQYGAAVQRFRGCICLQHQGKTSWVNSVCYLYGCVPFPVRPLTNGDWGPVHSETIRSESLHLEIRVRVDQNNSQSYYLHSSCVTIFNIYNVAGYCPVSVSLNPVMITKLHSQLALVLWIAWGCNRYIKLHCNLQACSILLHSLR
jgi:hypothetical protein